MAALHAGITERFNCEKCTKNPQIKEKLCCDSYAASNRSLFDIEYGENVYQFYHCPIKFISQNIFLFYKQYKYQKDFPSAPMPEFNNVSNKWLMAIALYEQKYNEFEQIVVEQRMAKK